MKSLATVKAAVNMIDEVASLMRSAYQFSIEAVWRGEKMQVCDPGFTSAGG